MASEIFNEQLEKARKISGYNKIRSSRILDDLATAYISNQFDGLDSSYYAVKSIRKSLLSQGFTVSEIDDYLLEYSYITKTQINKLRNQSIYMNDGISIVPEIENIKDRELKRINTDLIIDTLKSKPALLSALQKNISQQALNKYYNIKNATALKEFYNNNKEIID